MSDVDPTKTGRTYADAFVEIFSTWRLIFLVLGSLVITFFVVHISAEPGTPIEFIGVIKYQKAKSATPSSPQQTPADETANYYLPTEAKLYLGGDVAVPILDGTLAIKPSRYFLLLVGDNVENVRVGVRKIDGTPSDFLQRDGDKAIVFDLNTYLEVIFRGKYFAVEIREVDRLKTATVTARSITRPTLKLRAISELTQTGGDE